MLPKILCYLVRNCCDFNTTKIGVLELFEILVSFDHLTDTSSSFSVVVFIISLRTVCGPYGV